MFRYLRQMLDSKIPIPQYAVDVTRTQFESLFSHSMSMYYSYVSHAPSMQRCLCSSHYYVNCCRSCRLRKMSLFVIESYLRFAPRARSFFLIDLVFFFGVFQRQQIDRCNEAVKARSARSITMVRGVASDIWRIAEKTTMECNVT